MDLQKLAPFFNDNMNISTSYKIPRQQNNRFRHVLHRVLIVIPLLSLLILGGCTKWLELKPSGDVIEKDFWINKESVNSFVTGCYRSMSEYAFMERLVLWGEGRSDNVVSLISGDDINRMVNIDLTPTNGYCTWGPFYKTINRCNLFLEKASAVMEKDPNFTRRDFLNCKAEVVAIRSLCYFNLVKAFRRVPWIVAASTEAEQDFNVPQSSDTLILANIIADLDTAYQNAQDSYMEIKENKGRITKNAVLSILADIYLWNNQYEKCIEACDLIINSHKNNLVDNAVFFNEVFKIGNSTESIFELQFGDKAGEMFNSVVWNYYSRNSIVPNLEFSPYLIPTVVTSPFNFPAGGGLIESEKDTRYTNFVDAISYPGLFYIFKYSGLQLTVDDITGKPIDYHYKTGTTSNWILYRLADILLMKAEALVQLDRNQDDLTEALDLVNKTYLRANPTLAQDGLQSVNYPDQASMSALVLRERQRELLFEGKRYYDLMRYTRRENSPAFLVSFLSDKRKGSVMQIGSKSLMDALYLPVNSELLKRSSNLTQNPYFETDNSDVSTSH